MRIPPEYSITHEMLSLISEIEAERIYFRNNPIQQDLKYRLHHLNLLKSSLFSAKIEGNTLTLENYELSSDKKQKLEIFNIVRATSYIERSINLNQTISIDQLLTLHKLVMEDITPDAGTIRKEISAIFNQAGVAIYLTPPPSQINLLLKKLLKYVNSPQEKFPLVKAFIAHLIFEKIHPFLDGNGRVGRLLISLILKSENNLFPLSVPFEEHLYNNRESYYHYLDIGIKDADSYILFMLESYLSGLQILKQDLNIEMSRKDRLYLPPRQEEIYYIVKDHGKVSFDFIRRRFMRVPERTLRYDLKKMQEKNFLVKIGTTRGSLYTVK